MRMTCHPEAQPKDRRLPFHGLGWNNGSIYDCGYTPVGLLQKLHTSPC